MGRKKRQAVDVRGHVDYVLAGATSRHVVVGPLLLDPLDHPYFIVATADAAGFRCDKFITATEPPQVDRARVMAELARRSITIHDIDDELEMVWLCDRLWPGEKIRQLRLAVEAEARERERQARRRMMH